MRKKNPFQVINGGRSLIEREALIAAVFGEREAFKGLMQILESQKANLRLASQTSGYPSTPLAPDL